MFTSIDKALVAVIMGAFSILNMVFGWTWLGSISPEAVSAIVAAITPFLVWLVPNKTTTPPSGG